MNFVEALQLAKAEFQANPNWPKLAGTPWENDAPVIAARLIAGLTSCETKQDENPREELERQKNMEIPTDARHTQRGR